MENVQVDLEAYKVAPYSREQEMNESRQVVDAVVLDYTVVKIDGDHQQKTKNLSRVLGRQLNHSSQTNGQESRTTLTMLSSMTQSKAELHDYQNQNSQRGAFDYQKLNIDFAGHVKHSSEHNSNQQHHGDDGNNTYGTSSVQGISISHSTIDHIGIGGGETVGQR